MNIATEGKLEIKVLLSTDTRSWALFPIAARRVAEFCTKYDSDADPVQMVSQLKRCFVEPKPGALVLLFIDDGLVVGHALISIETWFGTVMTTIVQMETERTLPRSLAREAMRFMENWSEGNGARFIQCLARNEKVARAFSIFHGFKAERVMMRKSLSTGVPDGTKPS